VRVRSLIPRIPAPQLSRDLQTSLRTVVIGTIASVLINHTGSGHSTFSLRAASIYFGRVWYIYGASASDQDFILSSEAVLGAMPF